MIILGGVVKKHQLLECFNDVYEPSFSIKTDLGTKVCYLGINQIIRVQEYHRYK